MKPLPNRRGFLCAEAHKRVFRNNHLRLRLAEELNLNP